MVTVFAFKLHFNKFDMKYLLTILIAFSMTDCVNAQKIILAQIEINHQNEAAFFSQTEKLIKSTRNENGCISFNINCKSEKLTELVIFEIFADDTAFKNHLKQPYVIEWFKMLNEIKKTELTVTELKTLN